MPDHDHRPHLHAEAPEGVRDHREEADCPGDDDGPGEMVEPLLTPQSGGNSPPPPKPPVNP